MPTPDTEYRNGMRIYPVPGPNGEILHFPSVTTVLNILPKPASLLNYIEWDPEKAEKNMKRRAMVGSTAHYYFECVQARKLQNHNPIIEEDIQFNKFFNAKTAKAIGEICKKIALYIRFNDFEPWFLEEKTWSHELQTAGRVDFIGKFNGVSCILDLKTAKSFYPPENGIDPHALQLAAYKQGLKEVHGIEVEKLYILRVNEAKQPQLKEVSDDKDGFLMARELFREEHGF
ncbi:MAG: PD-(D/E)XK nuclease family protein [Candidatus Omnitrophica bacterium]|nr:PD-(D/E)XK nuclease family protein [Candidatus Omnitrophota bacterium]